MLVMKQNHEQLTVHMWFWHYKLIPLGNDFQVFVIFDILFSKRITLFPHLLAFRSTVRSAYFLHIPPAAISGTIFHCFNFCPCLKLVSTSYGQTTPHMTADHGICTASSHLGEAAVCNMVAGWLFVWKSLSTRDTETVLKERLVPEMLGCLCCRLLDSVVLLTDVIPDQRSNASSSFQCKDSTITSLMDWRWSGIETPY